MNTNDRFAGSKIAGFVLHALVTLPMVVAGVGKAFHVAPGRVLSMFQTTFHLDQQMTMIGLGELLCVVLLLWPRTLRFGILMVSAYWGGAIVIHMSSGQSYVLTSVLLVMSWAGYWLRLDGDGRRALLGLRASAAS
jgi:hypothetical protein